MTRVFLGLGSNMGDREDYLQQAIDRLDSHPHIRVINNSPIYETEPFGYRDQPYFLNMVVEVETELNAHELLQITQTIEKELGRKREIHWGPRTIDIDILLYGNEIIVSPELTIPHPYMRERLFVLKPLYDIYKGSIPSEPNSIESLIDQLSLSCEEVKIWKI
ncbi:2-amino-4-hydroxy-6-hydroxymethyldihydropteridine diphosphokinase [Tepidibacillus fermentans]|uniref:2-amino-4-hydroxy-6-hydroxymethyldihydropteridine diphosphokinase n=1 Tax=Tepidibacillus fermentans TaxID=1281767 RepID=A0A4R3KAU1_9BACI|nr:2-amino-4-hydroxy-6-hydroxymethyldihydropteridine diphosphokinase [Tepidibacillus fermentans]TCS80137.1 2-amino-4-hydroxy-6-hydroxymethyldihydropteridine diphosphokinase [Tepidibacillus fermentans]